MGKERVQVISRDGEPEYAVLPYADYLELLRQAEGREAPLAVSPVPERASVAPKSGAKSGLGPTNQSGAADTPFDPAELVRLRKRAGMNQSQLAKASRLGMMNLIQIETGQRQPSASMRADLARALKVETL